MNKFFLLIFIFVTCSWAKTPETVIVLETISTRGAPMNRDIVIVKEGMVMVNKEKLSANEIITQSEHIKKIAQFSSSEKIDQCRSGSFKHIFKQEKLVKEEQGCLNSSRYLELKKHFKNLKKDSITE